MQLINGRDVIEHAEINGESREFIRKLNDYIEDAPEIDLVRCKDCKWFPSNMDETNSDEDYLMCPMDKWTNADDFCSCGERKESE